MKTLDAKDMDRAFCPIINTASLIGDKWMLSIIRECFAGSKRFDEFQTHLSVSRSVLTNKLKGLVQTGILEKVPYQEDKSRPRFEYKLSAKGRQLAAILMALMEWGNDNLEFDTNQAVQVIERETGKPVRLTLINSDGEFVPWKNTQLHFYEKGPKS